MSTRNDRENQQLKMYEKQMDRNNSRIHTIQSFFARVPAGNEGILLDPKEVEGLYWLLEDAKRDCEYDKS